VKSFDEFMSKGVDDKDPYWSLFEINRVANQAVLNAIKYGYEQAQADFQNDLNGLCKQIHDKDQEIIRLTYNSGSRLLYEFSISDDNGLSMDRIHNMAENCAVDARYEGAFDIEYNEDFRVVLEKTRKNGYDKNQVSYHFVVLKKYHGDEE
jgi:hypothetical protein